MGTKMGQPYATLTLAFLEENLHEKIGENTAKTKKKHFPFGWLVHILEMPIAR